MRLPVQLYRFGSGGIFTLLDNVRCKGDEPNILSCSYISGSDNCVPHEAVGVQCSEYKQFLITNISACME